MKKLNVKKKKKFNIFVILTPFLFLLPSLVIIFTFQIFPIIYSFIMSFFHWDMINAAGPKFIGLTNYISLLFEKSFWHSMFVTVYFAGVSVPLGIVLALSIALLLNAKIKALGFFRTIYFLPVITSLAAISIVWKWLYNPQQGLLNYFLSLIGISPQTWLLDPKLAMPSIIIMSVWKNLGYNVVLFLSGLQNIDSTYYEAADIDGASSWQKFRNITMPLLTPTTFFILTMSIIKSFQVFTQIYIMTPTGGPLKATDVIVFSLFKNAFIIFRMGYACSIAYALFFVILTITLIQRYFTNKMVVYQ